MDNSNPHDDNAPNPEQANMFTTHDVRNEAEEALKRYFQTKPVAIDDEATSATITTEHVSLRLEIQGWSTPLTIMFTEEAVIGRKDPILAFTPEIDLTAYGGYQMGISRKHAVIRRTGDYLELVDLGSRNGTFHNGNKLEAEQAVILRHHDEIRLGKIVITLYVQQEEAL